MGEAAPWATISARGSLIAYRADLSFGFSLPRTVPESDRCCERYGFVGNQKQGTSPFQELRCKTKVATLEFFFNALAYLNGE